MTKYKRIEPNGDNLFLPSVSILSLLPHYEIYIVTNEVPGLRIFHKNLELCSFEIYFPPTTMFSIFDTLGQEFILLQSPVWYW